ncbi:cupin domain-containing protein [Paraburkholderia oxyphila]|uniref:cupin domain-containing protein n=1 Tax=Paraburkholderia oxyphila TaxID=614212 RepID=UPI000488317B|nr:cupin domain-containing protein [Paraburkholderia oxyphila]
MLVNADFSQCAIVAPRDYAWVASPQSGVERVMLDRIGAEAARATSIVRYTQNSHFPRHVHPGGEEILVLSGTFSDDEGDYPEGWYLRNPPGSQHQPHTAKGAVIFVKLQQMAAQDAKTVRIDTRDPAMWIHAEGREICPLHTHGAQQVSVQRIQAGETVFSGPVNGVELLVLSGELRLDSEAYERGAWLRLPADAVPQIVAGVEGATYYLKTGHLPDATFEAQR